MLRGWSQHSHPRSRRPDRPSLTDPRLNRRSSVGLRPRLRLYDDGSRWWWSRRVRRCPDGRWYVRNPWPGRGLPEFGDRDGAVTQLLKISLKWARMERTRYGPTKLQKVSCILSLFKPSENILKVNVCKQLKFNLDQCKLLWLLLLSRSHEPIFLSDLPWISCQHLSSKILMRGLNFRWQDIFWCRNGVTRWCSFAFAFSNIKILLPIVFFIEEPIS